MGKLGDYLDAMKTFDWIVFSMMMSTIVFSILYMGLSSFTVLFAIMGLIGHHLHTAFTDGSPRRVTYDCNAAIQALCIMVLGMRFCLL